MEDFQKKNGSGVTIFLIAIVALVLAYVFLSSQPIALDKEGSSDLSGLFGASTLGGAGQSVVANSVTAYFCPQEHCAQELIKRIDDANTSLYIAIYSFTKDDISDALIRAKERGVDIKVVFDYDQSKNEYSDDEKLTGAGIPIKRMDGAGYMHNKFTIIDGGSVATGSFNYSENADQRNNENLIFITSEEIAQRYKTSFDDLWERATK